MSRKTTIIALASLLLPAACEEASEPETVILFGDLHSHTSNSLDALMQDLPLVGGTAARGPDTSCDFARHCSALDFWALTDHSEEQTVDIWLENVKAVRACNAAHGGDTAEPDLVSFLGWEWTHLSDDPTTNWGHRCVVLRDTAADAIPARPIAARHGFEGLDPEMLDLFVMLAVSADPDNAELYEGARDRVNAVMAKPLCDPATDTLALPADCHEIAADPKDLHTRMARWAAEALVIPHGTSWGSHHEPGSSWQFQHSVAMHNPRFERLLEIDSGHGNGEAYRGWRHVSGTSICPTPTNEFEPCCYRAGEIVRARSETCAAEPDGAGCVAEVNAAQQDFLARGRRGMSSLSGTEAEDWLDCGQCRDCFQPASDYRPMGSAQAAWALTDFDDAVGPWRYRLGVVGSTDSHRTGPGAGYKESWQASDAFEAIDESVELLVGLAREMVTPDPGRQNSYLYSGSLAAVHAGGRSRQAIFEAMQQRRTYATSGPRIELWFVLVNGPQGRAPMGSNVVLDRAPRFEVRARGAPIQAAGCPDAVLQARGQGFIDEVCFGECYNPMAGRHAITRIEMVKITPQVTPDEDLADLIEDPWQVHSCAPEAEECSAIFEDADFTLDARHALYYVRAIQEPQAQFNAGNLRCERDVDGHCIASRPCLRDDEDGCLVEQEELAWSSPIYIDP